jgi:[histone H3]-lysine36 N-trimethyltransferase
MSLSLITSLKEEHRSPSLSALAPHDDIKMEGVAVKVNEEVVVPPTDPGETLNGFPPPKLEASASPKDSESPASSTPPVPGKRKPKPTPIGPQLIPDLHRAEEAAFATFTEINENHYQYGTLGRSREALESMICDCQYEHGTFRRCIP